MKAPSSPDWPALRNIAAVQGGYFHARQASAVGFSSQLLARHVQGGRLIRPRRAVYRLAQYAAVDHEDLVELWVWSEQRGVFSHDTALALHELSDALPARVHLTVPRASRRRAAPPGVVLHHSDVPDDERVWIGLVPVTSAARTIRDAADDGLHPAVIEQAIVEGTARGLFGRIDVRGIVPPRRGRPRGSRSRSVLR